MDSAKKAAADVLDPFFAGFRCDPYGKGQKAYDNDGQNDDERIHGQSSRLNVRGRFGMLLNSEW